MREARAACAPRSRKSGCARDAMSSADQATIEVDHLTSHPEKRSSEPAEPAEGADSQIPRAEANAPVMSVIGSGAEQ